MAALTVTGAASGQQSPNPSSEPATSETAAAAAQSVPSPSSQPPEAQRESPPRILGVIPEFGVTNRHQAPSLTPGEKIRLFTRQAFDPFEWVAAGAQAGWSQEQNGLAGYGQGAAGYGKRYGAAMADVTDHEFLANFLFPVLLKQDPRYFRLGRGSVPHRFIYSLEQEFWTKTDRGSRQFNYSKVLGALGSKALSNVYSPPDSRGWSLTLTRTGTSLLSGMASGLGAEFWPDIDCKVFHKCRGK